MNRISGQSNLTGKSSDTESVDCSICQGTFGPDCATVKTLCNHLFHETCLYAWLDVGNGCPMCRAVLSRRTITPCDLHGALLSTVQRKDFSGLEKAALLIEQGASLTDQELRNVLLSRVQRNDIFATDYVKLLISMGASLTQQELHDLLLSSVREVNTYGREWANLFISLNARLTRHELRDLLMSAISRGDDYDGLQNAKLLINQGAHANLDQQDKQKLYDTLLSIIRDNSHRGPTCAKLLTIMGISLTPWEAVPE